MPASATQKQTLDERFPVIYDQLRRIAHSMLGRRANATLSPTAVVHDAYAKLAEAGQIPNLSEAAFKGIAAHVMRQVLCDAARKRLAAKRGGKSAVRVPLTEELQDTEHSLERIVLVSDFLARLESVNSRQASVVELLFFGGLTLAEVATALDISPATAERDWRSARAWLATQARP